jgi:hypothetical protein
VAAVLGAGGVAHAGELGDACATAAEEGERLRDDHKLLAARKAFLTCSRNECPDVVKTDCAKWYVQLAQSIPTIVVQARDADQRDVRDARLLVDGALVRARLDGLPVEIDPGDHTVSVDAPGFAAYSEHLLIAEGEHGRNVPVTLRRAVTAAHASHRMSAWIPWTVGFVGLAALGGFAAAEIVGQNDYTALRSLCGSTRTCTSAQAAPARTDFIIAAVTLGVGVLALGSATILFIVRAHDDHADTIALGVRGTF